MMTLTLKSWGNAQAVRLPKALRERVGMEDGSQVEATVKNGAIVLKPVHPSKRIIQVADLSQVFRHRTEECHANEDPFGDAMGEEAL